MTPTTMTARPTATTAVSESPDASPTITGSAAPVAEIGAAWSKRSEEGRDYLSLKLDDPSFTAPIYANLFEDEGGEGYTLLWSRPRRNGE